MTITGKKINELTLSTILTNDSVFPLVIVQDGVAESVAKKITISQLASYLGNNSGAPTSYYYEYPNWTISSDNKILTVEDMTDARAVWVFKNGVKLRPDTSAVLNDNDYYLSGTNLIFNVALENTDVINLEVF